ncbi:hypothetical protein HGRIS_006114 [Hohenbuehelia grisea]|uniref:Uncharacterized protein n=1 Tax=Hohenbuehelia grisea TaxID=104357 RepID=A0ABR3K1E8_9AGAR
MSFPYPQPFAPANDPNLPNTPPYTGQNPLVQSFHQYRNHDQVQALPQWEEKMATAVGLHMQSQGLHPSQGLPQMVQHANAAFTHFGLHNERQHPAVMAASWQPHAPSQTQQVSISQPKSLNGQGRREFHRDRVADSGIPEALRKVTTSNPLGCCAEWRGAHARCQQLQNEEGLHIICSLAYKILAGKPMEFCESCRNMAQSLAQAYPNIIIVDKVTNQSWYYPNPPQSPRRSSFVGGQAPPPSYLGALPVRRPTH